MTYKVTVNGKEIEYGPLVEQSSFSEEEWQAIHQEIVKQNQPEVFEKKKDDTDYISTFGALISLEERYEALLEALPQKSYSYAGTHPMWVVKAVEENTLNKETTMEDVADMVERCETLDDLKEELTDYFDLEEL
ncbi:TPA: hypothetical protein ACJRS7_001247 [Streptococcus agalactiae]